MNNGSPFKMFSFVSKDNGDISVKCVRDGCHSTVEMEFDDSNFEYNYLYSGYSSSSDDPDKSDLIRKCKCCGVAELATNIDGLFRGFSLVDEDPKMKCLSCSGVMEYSSEIDNKLVYEYQKCSKREQI